MNHQISTQFGIYNIPCIMGKIPIDSSDVELNNFLSTPSRSLTMPAVSQILIEFGKEKAKSQICIVNDVVKHEAGNETMYFIIFVDDEQVGSFVMEKQMVYRAWTEKDVPIHFVDEAKFIKHQSEINAMNKDAIVSRILNEAFDRLMTGRLVAPLKLVEKANQKENPVPYPKLLQKAAEGMSMVLNRDSVEYQEAGHLFYDEISILRTKISLKAGHDNHVIWAARSGPRTSDTLMASLEGGPIMTIRQGLNSFLDLYDGRYFTKHSWPVAVRERVLIHQMLDNHFEQCREFTMSHDYDFMRVLEEKLADRGYVNDLGIRYYDLTIEGNELVLVVRRSDSAISSRGRWQISKIRQYLIPKQRGKYNPEEEAQVVYPDMDGLLTLLGEYLDGLKK